MLNLIENLCERSGALRCNEVVDDTQRHDQKRRDDREEQKVSDVKCNGAVEYLADSKRTKLQRLKVCTHLHGVLEDSLYSYST